MDMELIRSALASTIRHAATVAAGWLSANGITTGDETEAVTGVFMGLAALAWSFYQKKRTVGRK